jgi:hypothetical protein
MIFYHGLRGWETHHVTRKFDDPDHLNHWPGIKMCLGAIQAWIIQFRPEHLEMP